MKFKKGDIVTVKAGYCYARYSQFAKLHPWYALRWAYSHAPHEDREYRVIGVHGDIVVVQDTVCKIKKTNPIYFMNPEGVFLLHKEANND